MACGVLVLRDPAMTRKKALCNALSFWIGDSREDKVSGSADHRGGRKFLAGVEGFWSTTWCFTARLPLLVQQGNKKVSR